MEVRLKDLSSRGVSQGILLLDERGLDDSCPTGEDTHGSDYFTSIFLLPQLCNSTSLGEQGILAYTDPQIGKILEWAYIAWGEKGNAHGPGPTLYINVRDKTGDDSLIQRKGLGTALYVLACIKAGKRLKSHPDQPRETDGKKLAKAMDQIDIEGILRGDISPEIVGLHAD